MLVICLFILVETAAALTSCRTISNAIVAILIVIVVEASYDVVLLTVTL